MLLEVKRVKDEKSFGEKLFAVLVVRDMGIAVSDVKLDSRER